jgi:hypothetical protein
MHRFQIKLKPQRSTQAVLNRTRSLQDGCASSMAEVGALQEHFLVVGPVPELRTDGCQPLHPGGYGAVVQENQKVEQNATTQIRAPSCCMNSTFRRTRQ